jgi:hypothetical protein
MEKPRNVRQSADFRALGDERKENERSDFSDAREHEQLTIFRLIPDSRDFPEVSGLSNNG